MPDKVANGSNTAGFIDLSELESEQVTTVSPDLLRDVLQALEVLERGGFNDGHVHLIRDPDDDSNPALAFSTDLSNDVAVMIGPRKGDRDA